MAHVANATAIRCEHGNVAGREAAISQASGDSYGLGIVFC
jgi:hypothetical protein